MDESMITTLIILGSLVLITVIVLLIKHFEKKRREALEAVAIAMGLVFSAKPDENLLPSLGQFPLFSMGHSKKIKNLMQGTVKRMKILLFDYKYTTGGGKNSHTHQQTVMLVQSDVIQLPSFSLKPEHVFHKIGKKFGYQDINWESHPAFSDKYLLRAADVEACRSVFTEKVLEYYEQRPGLSTEASGDKLLFFRTSKKVKPEVYPDFLKDGLHIFALFSKRR